MKKTFFSSIAICCSLCVSGQLVLPSTEVQIKTAVLAAPSDKKDGALVYGYGEDGTFRVLRQGGNDFVCIADDPKKDGISVACYHKELEPFMERGRVLVKEGKNQKEIFDIRRRRSRVGSC